jgi:hypothetical protein
MESCRASFLSILNGGLSPNVRYFGIGLEASDSLSLSKYLGFNDLKAFPLFNCPIAAKIDLLLLHFGISTSPLQL